MSAEMRAYIQELFDFSISEGRFPGLLMRKFGIGYAAAAQIADGINPADFNRTRR